MIPAFFLAIDFDDGAWQENAAAVRAVCNEWEIPCGVERSRSGEGAHLWVFFEDPVPCAIARKLGSALLTAAMEREGKLKLDAYDRMFPCQDALPNGGFGNLIALPLQGQARKKGNSLFVDEMFHPYPDQWAGGNITPSPGMMIFFDWNNPETGGQDGVTDRVGIVSHVENGTIYTIEGNSIGDSCLERTRTVGDYQIMGYGIPSY